MSPEPKRILDILASWVAAGMDADAIVERLGNGAGPVAVELRRWVERRGGVPLGAHDPGAPRPHDAETLPDTKPIDVSDLPDVPGLDEVPDGLDEHDVLGDFDGWEDND